MPIYQYHLLRMIRITDTLSREFLLRMASWVRLCMKNNTNPSGKEQHVVVLTQLTTRRQRNANKESTMPEKVIYLAALLRIAVLEHVLLDEVHHLLGGIHVEQAVAAQ